VNANVAGLLALLCGALLASSAACRDQKQSGEKRVVDDKPAVFVAVSPGVDFASKVVRIGALNDESGPAKAIGVPFAIGKRLLVREVNAGGYLPEGWKLQLVERDHGYQVDRSVAAYDEIRGDVLFISTLFGTATSVGLRSQLEGDRMVAFPASLASDVASFAFTPPSGASYAAEAQRALGWFRGETQDNVGVAIVYNDDGYGRDALGGWRSAATDHGVQQVGEYPLAAGTEEVKELVAGLLESKASAVFLATLPTTTRAILVEAHRRDYRPIWLGSTPAWTDGFFARAAEHEVFETFHWLSSVPFWGEDIPGMNRFLAAWDTHGAEFGEADFYIFTSYLAGLIQVEILARTLGGERIDRNSFLESLQSMQGWTAGGLLQEVSYSTFPYPSMRAVRILRPDFARRSWLVVSDFAQPASGATH